MRIYFDSFGSIYSLSKKDAVEVLSEMLKNDGEYNLYKPSMRMVNGKIDEYGYFKQGKKLRVITLNMVSTSDDWENHGKEKVEMILERINK